MPTKYKSLEVLIDGARKAYIDDQETKGIRASGKSAKSIRITTDERGGALYGVKYFIQQKLGRKPGKFPPLDDILDWIRVKNIRPKDSKTTERQLAFLFARKIAQSGTDIYLGKRPVLDPSEKIDELVKKFLIDFTREKKKEIVQTIKQSLA
jgi:hypothetical protein